MSTEATLKGPDTGWIEQMYMLGDSNPMPSTYEGKEMNTQTLLLFRIAHLLEDIVKNGVGQDPD